MLLSNTFYGTASGGSSGYGTLFKVNTDGAGFTNLHNFAASYFDPTLKDFTDSDGVFPPAD